MADTSAREDLVQKVTLALESIQRVLKEKNLATEFETAATIFTSTNTSASDIGTTISNPLNMSHTQFTQTPSIVNVPTMNSSDRHVEMNHSSLQQTNSLEPTLNSSYSVTFSGGDPCKFIRGYEEFFKVNPMSEVDMIQYVMQDFEGEALEWYFDYVERIFLDTWTPDSWEDFVIELYRRFASETQVFVERTETEIVKDSESNFVGNEPFEVVHNLFVRMPKPVKNIEQQILQEKFIEDEKILSKFSRKFNFLHTMVEYVNLNQVLRYDFDRWSYWLSMDLNFVFDPGDLSQLIKFVGLNSYYLTNILQTNFTHSKSSMGSCGIKIMDDYCLWECDTTRTKGPIVKEEGLQVRGHENKHCLGMLDIISGRNDHSKNVTGNAFVEMNLRELARKFDGHMGKCTWRSEDFTRLKGLLKKRKMTGLRIKSRRFQMGNRDCRLTMYSRGQSQPP